MSALLIDIYLTSDRADRSLREDARLELTSSPKWFYDARGSHLFEDIQGTLRSLPGSSPLSVCTTFDTVERIVAVRHLTVS